MSFRLLNDRVHRWLAFLSLAAYGSLGLFGHSLHELLPCSDPSCGAHAQAESHCGCCHGDEHEAEHAASSIGDGVRAANAPHDANDCSLCVLLAKMKVGRVDAFATDICVGVAYHEPAFAAGILPADLVLASSPRAPPIV